MENPIIPDGTIIEWDNYVEGHLTGEVLDDHSAEYLKVAYYRPGHEGLTVLPNLARRRLTISENQSDARKITADIARKAGGSTL